VLWCVVAVCSGVLLQGVAACCSVLQCVAGICSIYIARYSFTQPMRHRDATNSLRRCVVAALLRCVAVCCSVLQCDAVWCSVLQCIASYSVTQEMSRLNITNSASHV